MDLAREAALCSRAMAKKADPNAPMEALLADELPDGPGWQYEPKWDGFRCIARRNGDEVELISKSGKPLARYFPDMVEKILKESARKPQNQQYSSERYGAGIVDAPAAVLKRCGRCRDTLYCGAGCQAEHWPEHRAGCAV